MLAPLPPGSRVPFSHNPLFVGRTADLMALMHILQQPLPHHHFPPYVPTIAITGMGGLGKTQLAVELLYRFGTHFPGGIFWINCTHVDAIPAEIAACGSTLHLVPEYADLPLHIQVQHVLQAWHTAIPRLLIFDNCEEEAILEQWRPTHGGCRVVVTSRRRLWAASLGIHIWPLSLFSRQDSLHLFEGHGLVQRDALPILQAIAAELGDLPLAIHLAGHFLAKNAGQISPTTYLQQLQNPSLQQRRSTTRLTHALTHPSFQGMDQTPTGHIQHIMRTFALSYDQLRASTPIDRLARIMLGCASYFAPGEPIPSTLLLEATSSSTPGRTPPEKKQLDAALERLLISGLLEQTAPDTHHTKTGSLRMHRLIAGFVQTLKPTQRFQAAVEQTFIREATSLSDYRLPSPILAFQGHLRPIVEAASVRQDDRAAQLYALQGWHLTLLSAYPAARPFLQESITRYTTIHGAAHPLVAGSTNMLGLLYQWEGNLVAAQPCFEHALQIWEQQREIQQNYIASALNNLGLLLTERGDYRAAQQALDRALTIYCSTVDAHHPDVLRTRTNRGHLFTVRGLFVEAEIELTEVLAVRQHVLPAQHPSLAQTFHNLGDLYHAWDNDATALSYYQQACDMRRALFGPQHGAYAESLAGLGAVYAHQGDLLKARHVLEQAVTITMTHLGGHHIETAHVCLLLGRVYATLGDVARSRALFRSVAQVYEQQLLLHHPSRLYLQNMEIGMPQER